MTAPLTTQGDEPTLSVRAAAARLGTSPWRVNKLALTGQLRVVARPGEPLKVVAADVERLAAGRK